MDSLLELCFGRKDSVKSIVFGILTKESPLKIIQLTNLVQRRHGKQVTFQGVRKAVHELVIAGALIEENSKYSIDKRWISQAKKEIDALHSQLFSIAPVRKRVDAIGEDLSVFTFDSIAEMMKFWQHSLESNKTEKGDINCYQTHHMWEAILFPESERKLMTKLLSGGTKSYFLITGNTILDKLTVKFYRDLGVKVSILSSRSEFDKEYAISTHGSLVIQTNYQKETALALDAFFKKVKKLENLNLEELAKIVSAKAEVKLSIAKNKNMAQQINKSIIDQVE
ncbi:MAG: hypothetical protein WCW44_02110 [archaeon]|jgi:hypothetical protein